MKLLVLLVVAIVVVLQFAVKAGAVCCGHLEKDLQTFELKCLDGTPTDACCGVGACNVFCCHCDGGCRKPIPERIPGDDPMEDILRERTDGTHDVTLGDRDGDRKMSLEEGLAHLDHLKDKEVVKRSLREMDLDGDGFLSPMEVDHSL